MVEQAHPEPKTPVPVIAAEGRAVERPDDLERLRAAMAAGKARRFLDHALPAAPTPPPPSLRAEALSRALMAPLFRLRSWRAGWSRRKASPLLVTDRP